jgi:hypothetical protein
VSLSLAITTWAILRWLVHDPSAINHNPLVLMRTIFDTDASLFLA